MLPLEKINEAEFSQAVTQLNEAGLLGDSLSGIEEGAGLEMAAVEGFLAAVENLYDVGKEKEIPPPVIRFYNSVTDPEEESTSKGEGEEQKGEEQKVEGEGEGQEEVKVQEEVKEEVPQLTREEKREKKKAWWAAKFAEQDRHKAEWVKIAKKCTKKELAEKLAVTKMPILWKLAGSFNVYPSGKKKVVLVEELTDELFKEGKKEIENDKHEKFAREAIAKTKSTKAKSKSTKAKTTKAKAKKK